MPAGLPSVRFVMTLCTVPLIVTSRAASYSPTTPRVACASSAACANTGADSNSNSTPGNKPVSASESLLLQVLLMETAPWNAQDVVVFRVSALKNWRCLCEGLLVWCANPHMPNGTQSPARDYEGSK